MTSKTELDTPALCLDLDALERNIAAMADRCRQQGIGWRPHAKCHKSIMIARKLIEAGASGITCAKLGEAEVLATAGIHDLLIANLIVGPAKVQRLAELRQYADPIVCVDHLDQALPISRACRNAGVQVRVLLEVDIGMRRVGVSPGEPALVLARQLEHLPGLQLAGIMGYEGHLLLIADPQEKQRAIAEALGQLTATRELLVAQGFPCPIVSCGGTGSYLYSVPHPGITEVQAGGLIFMDAFYRHSCHVPDFEYALTVLATVVSRPAPDRAIVDAGRKAMNQELHLPLVKGREDIRVRGLSAEHGILELERTAADLKIGDRLEFIPGYADLTTVLHDVFHVCRGDQLQETWPLEARGKLQ